MSSGVEEIVPMAGYGQKEDELDGSINCKPLIDGLLMKKAVSQKQKQVVHSCLLYTSPSPRDYAASRMPSSA